MGSGSGWRRARLKPAYGWLRLLYARSPAQLPRLFRAQRSDVVLCGTGMENHGKYNELIYSHSGDSLFVNLFVASVLHWKEKGITLKQETLFPYEAQSKLTITQGASRVSLLNCYPGWINEGALRITVNGKAVSYSSHPSSYVAIKRLWRTGDVVEMKLPMHNTIEHLPNVPSYIAIMHGPVLLGAKTGTEDLRGLIADDSRWGQIASGEKLPLNKAPILIEDNIGSLTGNLVPVANEPLHYTFKNVKMENPVNITLEPFYGIHDARYMMYWMALSNNGYQTYLDSMAITEKQKLELQNRTIDFVAPGEQQPEADHSLQSDHSRKGFAQDKAFREAANGGYFSYNLATNSNTNLSLLVRYWGAEWGNRKYIICGWPETAYSR